MTECEGDLMDDILSPGNCKICNCIVSAGVIFCNNCKDKITDEMVDLLTRKVISSEIDEIIDKFEKIWRLYQTSPEYMKAIRLAQEIELDGMKE